MLDYLMNYGVQRHSVKYEEIDINDRMRLEDQINLARKSYMKLLELLDEVHGKYLSCINEISKRSKEIISENPGSRSNNLFSVDDQYLQLDAEAQALKSGMNIINAEIDFYKNDLKILNSVFYNKF